MCGNPLRLLSPVAAVFGAASDQRKALRAQEAAQREAAAAAAKTQADAQQAEAKANRQAPNLASLFRANKVGSAAATLLRYATKGCPVKTGRSWTIEEIEAAIKKGPHKSAMLPAAMAQLHAEVAEKVEKGQARVMEWESLKTAGVPAELKISPIAMIPSTSPLQPSCGRCPTTTTD